MTAEWMVVVDGNPARVVFDLVGAPRAEVDRFLQGYTSGFLAGVERGRQLADDEAQAAHQLAYRVVQAMARIEPHAVREERRRARQVAAAESRALEARPLPDETAPITRGAGEWGFVNGGRGWPLEVVLTPAEAAYAEGVAS